ncbi:MAG: sigma-70 family RNA polymerase sigma factor [Solirubrobacterales bacterium]
MQKLQDEALIEHLVAARDAGDDEQMALAVSILCFKYEPRIRAMGLAKGIKGTHLDDLVQDVFESSIKSATGFSGSHVGEIVNWIKTITRFRIADYYKAIERVPDLDSIDATEDEGNFTIEPSEPGETSASPTRIMLYELLAEFPKPHRAVVICRLAGFKSKEAASMINNESMIDETSMTATNVDKIYSRFRTELRIRLMMDSE